MAVPPASYQVNPLYASAFKVAVHAGTAASLVIEVGGMALTVLSDSESLSAKAGVGLIAAGAALLVPFGLLSTAITVNYLREKIRPTNARIASMDRNLFIALEGTEAS